MPRAAELRRLGRAALLAPAGRSRGRVPDAIEHIAKAHRAHHPRADLDILRRAYRLAESSHRGQFRKSGEPYITHPLAVTLILAQLGAETTTLTASLLHDTVEDTDLTLDQVGEQFGTEVRRLVDGVTKLEKVEYGAAAEPETFRKMLVATGDDVRVMSIKLADRLHNMRTLGVMRPEKQARIAKVTRDVLIPLAERLGVQVLKTELEDLVFGILHPEDYARAKELMAAHAQLPDPLQVVAASVAEVLRQAGIPATVEVRPRHVVSVHRVRVRRGARPGGPDFGRILVLVGEDADCYAVLGELHTCFVPVIAEFKDFIAAPKFNLYQSLHTAVADDRGQVAEVLVRTRRMHRVAETGVIGLGDPHTSYGPGAAQSAPGADPLAAGGRAAGEPGAAGDGADPARPGWLSRLLDWQRDMPDPDSFWTALRDELAQDQEITVFPDHGRALVLPSGASCVDAAYAVHGEAAHACVGTRVNGRLVPLGTLLKDGDSVHLLLADGAGSGPSPHWLENARTPAARIAIRRWLDAHPQAAPGASRPAPPPTAAEDAARREGAGPGSEVPGGDAPDGTVPARAVPDGAAPASAVPPGTVPVGAVPGAPAPASAAPAPVGAAPLADAPAAVRAPARRGSQIDTGRPGATARLARCCTPVPPDDVTGFVIRGGTIAVHRAECPTAGRMAADGRDRVAVSWRHGGPPAAGYRATLFAEALGRPRLLADLTEVIAGQGVAIVHAAVEPPREHRVRHTYTVELPEAAALTALMRAMRAVPGVYDVYRAQRRIAAARS
jgi:GTP pyrophosphokinase